MNNGQVLLAIDGTVRCDWDAHFRQGTRSMTSQCLTNVLLKVETQPSAAATVLSSSNTTFFQTFRI